MTPGMWKQGGVGWALKTMALQFEVLTVKFYLQIGQIAQQVLPSLTHHSSSHHQALSLSLNERQK